MNAGKQYSVRALRAADEAAIAEVLREHPLWKRKHARDLVARQKFIAGITEAGVGLPCVGYRLVKSKGVEPDARWEREDHRRAGRPRRATRREFQQ